MKEQNDERKALQEVQVLLSSLPKSSLRKNICLLTENNSQASRCSIQSSHEDGSHCPFWKGGKSRSGRDAGDVRSKSIVISTEFCTYCSLMVMVLKALCCMSAKNFSLELKCTTIIFIR
ncbi:hypothetical protein R5R35_009187 [Gryllus longicercus]|uniref:Uncharacterized protein n=1 Tax=Gryllus longicercus TaxID=2509291 RepID=A0AAN9VKM1_9ORTH